ncbi:MAG: RNA polymerase sigma factor region1.1 domain-containing protein, partial [Burkholderiaceae bacterium]
MPAQKLPKSESPADNRATAAKTKVIAKPATKATAKAATAKTVSPPIKKAPPVPASKSAPPTAAKEKKTAVLANTAGKATATDAAAAKKKPGRPAKAAPAKPAVPVRIGAKRGPKPKGSLIEDDGEPDDLIDDEPEVQEETSGSTEKVKPLRMKISKAKERALMKEFGLDETVLSEEDLVKRRLQLKALLKLGKTRGYLTHGEISDHLPDKLVDAETME